MSIKSTPKIQLKLSYSNGRYFAPQNAEKRRVAVLMSTRSWKNAYLRVTYLPGVINEGMFYNKKDASAFLRACFEKEQLEYVYGGQW